MGHSRFGSLPQTRPWQQVVSLIAGGAGAAQIAHATVEAAERAFLKAGRDPGVVETVWLLMQLPLAARSDDFAAALRECGLDVSDEPGLLEIGAAVVSAIDDRLPNCRGRTDLGESAQMAAAETLSEVIGRKISGLFETSAADVRRAFAGLATAKQFGAFARAFFARFACKGLEYFLSKTLPTHVGDGKRFHNLAQQAEFTAALDLHCRETAGIVEAFAGDWLMKEKWEQGEVTRKGVENFTSYAMKKLTDELRQRTVTRAA